MTDIPQATQSKRSINKAGDLLREDSFLLGTQLDDALNTLGEWRASHAHPLQCVYMKLRDRARRIEQKPLVSQRLKRISSITQKLQRNPNMALSTIQDIGGCRAVLADIRNVRKLSSRLGQPVRDYIKAPKLDGYRGIHFVEQYVPTTERHEVHAGRKIEIQVRTRLQHAWATAVETVDSLLGQNIKGGKGDKDWRRFFALASCLIAIHEGCSSVPGCPTDQIAIKKELRKIVKQLEVFTKLTGLSSSIRTLWERTREQKRHAYVLVLDMEARRTHVTGFLKNQSSNAAAYYLETEKKYYGDPRYQVVQVQVSQIRELRRAYPNYYLDTQAFMRFLSVALDKKD